jgi:RND family efflux transporter MFP subunit
MLLPLLLAGCSEPEVAEPVIRPVRSIVVADARQMSGRQFPGVARAAQEVDLSFRVSGPLAQLPVNVGDSVVSNQVIAQIDPRDYEVNLLSAEGQLERAIAAQQRAQSEYERVQRIMEIDAGATSQRALDTAIAERDQSAATASSANATVSAAQDRLDYSSLRAPFDGVVVATYVQNFEEVRASQPIARIVNDNRIEMVVDIPESLISLLPTVADVNVEFDALAGRLIPAQISEIGTEASPITRTYPVTLIMDQPEGARILAGMAGRATGSAEQQSVIEQGIEVPLSALLTVAAGNSYVWVISDQMTVTRTAVETGALTDFGVLITAGIDPGDRLVTAGVSFLVEGQEVRLLQNEVE